jgi:hypothetical protein
MPLPVLRSRLSRSRKVFLGHELVFAAVAERLPRPDMIDHDAAHDLHGRAAHGLGREFQEPAFDA